MIQGNGLHQKFLKPKAQRPTSLSSECPSTFKVCYDRKKTSAFKIHDTNFFLQPAVWQWNSSWQANIYMITYSTSLGIFGFGFISKNLPNESLKRTISKGVPQRNGTLEYLRILCADYFFIIIFYQPIKCYRMIILNLFSKIGIVLETLWDGDCKVDGICTEGILRFKKVKGTT